VNAVVSAIVDLIAMLRENLDLPIKIDTNGIIPTCSSACSPKNACNIGHGPKNRAFPLQRGDRQLVDLRHDRGIIDAIIHAASLRIPHDQVPGLIDEAAIDEMSARSPAPAVGFHNSRTGSCTMNPSRNDG
jgi:hypothetical protein